MKVNILGTEYTIEKRNKDTNLNECDAYCDSSAKLIVIADTSRRCFFIERNVA